MSPTDAQLEQRPLETLHPPAIRAVSLGKTISGRHVLRDVTFDVAAGTFLALLGPNGAGKTTLIHILASLTAPTEGSVTIYGHDARRAEPHARSRIGVIGHSSFLYRDLSPLENLAFFGSLYAVDEPNARAMELLELVGLERRAHDPVKALSRGMTQRVAIARALMHDPDLLLADEPFAGLDVPCTRMLTSILTELNQAGKTIILATHDVHQCLALAERTLVMRAGRLILDEPTSAVDETRITEELMRT